MTDTEKKPKVAIIGGTGEFGRLFARIFKEDGHSVVITGRNQGKGERVSRTIGVEFTGDNKAAAKGADVVIISVPIDSTIKVIREVAPSVRSGSLLMDFTSVKKEPVEAMAEYAPEGVEILGCHPMFGPRVAGLEGQTVILTPLKGGKWAKHVEGFFTRHKARIYHSTPEEHDRVMAVVQGLTHFAYLTTASTIRRIDHDVELSRRFASPVYELMLDFIARIVGQNPRLYASIQMHNPFIKEVHKVFIEEAQKLKELVDKKDIEGFVRTMTRSARIFRDVDGSMGKSDKAISALTHELKRLKEAVGCEVALRHIYSGAIHVGRVVSVDPEIVVIENRGRRSQLKLSNIELLDEDAHLDWKKANLGTKKLDFSFIFPEEVDETVLQEVVKDTSEGVIGVEVVDVFKGRQIPRGKKSITFRVEFLEHEEGDEIERLLKGLGGEQR